MECAICFVECKLFKVLECGHFFCGQCINDLFKAPSAASCQNGPSSLKTPEKGACCENAKEVSKSLSGNFSGNTEENEKEAEIEVESIPCPQCRRLTPKSYAMKNKYVCKLLCRNCDEEKNAEEFRWCYDCEQSTCSRCFVDKHVTTDEVTSAIHMHKGCKWNANYPQALYCAKRLLQELHQNDETIQNNQKYTKEYLEGLQEYLCLEIEQRVKASLEPKQRLLLDLCAAFNINPTQLRFMEPSAKSTKNYRTLLDEVISIADLTMDNNSITTNLDEPFKLKCLPYKQMAEVLIENGKKLPFENNEPKPKVAKIDDRSTEPKIDLKQTTVIQHPQLINPSDICYLQEYDVVLITDYKNGLFSVDLKTYACQPVNGTWAGLHLCRITPVPQLQFGVENVVAINSQANDKEWKLTFVHIESEAQSQNSSTRQFSAGPKVKTQSISFPDKSNPKTACSERGFYCTTNRNLYHMKGQSLEWGEPIYKADSDLGRLCSTVQAFDNTKVKVYIFNRTWKSIDILLYDEFNRQILVNHRIHLLNECYGHMNDNFLTPMELGNDSLGPFIMANKGNTKLITWSGFFGATNGEKGTSETGHFQMFHDFKDKYPQKIIRCPYSFCLISQSIENSGARKVECCNIYY